MMKNWSFFFFVFTLLPTFSMGNQTDTLYFLENFKTTPKAPDFFYYGIRKYNKKGIGQTTYYLKSGELFSLQKETKGKKQGESIWYYNNGEQERKGNYYKNKPIGEHTYFDASGLYVRSVIYNWRHKIIAEYYISDSGLKIYTFSKRNSTYGKYKNEIKAFTEMGKFINETMIKPPIVEELAEATVTITFFISPDGNLINIESVYSSHTELEIEAIRIIKAMPNWTPAIHKRKRVYSEYSVSIYF